MTEPDLAALNAVQHETRRAVLDLHALLIAHNTPPRLTTHELSAAQPVVRDEVRTASMSIALVNPTGFVLRLGLAGGSAQPNARGFPIAASSVVVLPLAVDDLEIGLDDPAAIGSDTAVVWLMRFNTVQPFHLHRY